MYYEQIIDLAYYSYLLYITQNVNDDFNTRLYQSDVVAFTRNRYIFSVIINV